MGQAWSLVTKPLRNFNVESRAHKIVSKKQPAPAPKYSATIADIQRIKEDFPEAETNIHKKNPELEQRLKDVFVKSYDPEIEQQTKYTKNLPLNRQQVQDFEYGLMEPEVIPEGKITLRQALKFITDHQDDPRTNSAETIANIYKLDKTVASNIVNNFRMFQIHIPLTKETKAIFGTAMDPNKKLLNESKDESK